MTDADLKRFLTAQDAVLAQVEAELVAGRKCTHWMWFVFPQLAGLGHSAAAQHYAISGLDQARRYLADPVLGYRLRRHVRLILRHEDTTARAILGTPDDLKFRSCVTLFQAVAKDPADKALFKEALRQFYKGEPDPVTNELLDRSA